jgi:transcription factor IIIB 90 kDa subunit
MSRSWMTVGRRPNGLCGAAILIAAKIHGLRRTPAQIVKAVHACEETIRKRINEFKYTNTAMLTRSQLKEIEDTQADPKAFQQQEDHFQSRFTTPDICKKAIQNELQINNENEDEILDEL